MRRHQCLDCHSTDGTVMVGPTFRGMFGQREEVYVGGKPVRVVVDEAHLRKAILDPGARRVKGYPSAMPAVDLAPGELDQIGNLHQIPEMSATAGSPPASPRVPARTLALPSWRDFNQLTKVSISAASTFTAAAGFMAALRGFRWGLLTALLGTLLLAMGSCAINELQEMRHDARMNRTCGRPLPSGRISPLTALVIGTGMCSAGFAILLWRHGWPSALLGLLAMAWSTGSIRPRAGTAFAIIPGALIGAIPPAIGWAAAGGPLDSPAM